MTTPADTSSAPTASVTGEVASPGSGLGVEQVAEMFGRVAAMVEAGNPRDARRELATVTACADAATGALLVSCLAALERPRAVGVPMLRHLWKGADEQGRQLIEALKPRAATPLDVPGPVPAHRSGGRTRGPVGAVSARREDPKGRRSRGVAAGARDAARYFAQDAEVGGLDAVTDERGRGSDEREWVDDEAAALVAVSGTVCVACWIERPTAEQRRTDDDGLCCDCRDGGAVGVSVPDGADRAGRTRARVAHIAAHAASPDQAWSLLMGEWRRARGADRRVIVEYVQQHPDTVAAAAEGR